ncbi:MAG TPA: anti-sigma factor [Candidatus Acidoferrales bacterium]
MSCNFPGATVHGYLDGELDAVRAAEFERHLEECPECVAALDAQESLRSSLQRANLYENTPLGLQQKILAAQRALAPAVPSSRRVFAQWLAIAAALILIAWSCWRIIPNLTGPNSQSAVAAQVVDAHLRSLEPGHLTDVLSTDQHTVKPWFDGKLDFAPPVQDFAADGFPLTGGRLDVVSGRTVAALVYARRKHFINVFIWPTRESDSYPLLGAQQGYNWMSWRKNGMAFWLVSDVSTSDLEDLQHLLSR